MRPATTEEDLRPEFQGLLQRARDGDNSARAQLYVDYSQHFRKLIAKRLHRRQLAWATTPHDIFHTVVLRVWQEDTLALLRTEVDFLKYVSRAVNHEIVDLSRSLTAGRRDFRRQETLPDTGVPLIATQADPVRQACAAEELAWIKSQLSPPDREVLDLWLAGTHWNHIAARFAISVEAVRKRFHRALDSIRENTEYGMPNAESRQLPERIPRSPGRTFPGPRRALP